MFKNIKTIYRRFFQPFWDIFDRVITPFSKYGIIVGISGGTDSRVLLEVLAKYAKRIRGNYITTIVNHYVRKVNCNESIFILNRSKILGYISCLTNIYNKYLFLSKNEFFFRIRRYNTLWNIAKLHKYTSLSTAHTRKDIVESFLMNILGWGGGEIGTAMPLIRKTSTGFLLRPFLNFERYKISNVLGLLGVFDYFKDMSNFENFFMRSFVRNKVLTFLQKSDKNSFFRCYYLSQYAYSLKNYFEKKIILQKRLFIPFYIKTPFFIIKRVIFKNINNLYRLKYSFL